MIQMVALNVIAVCFAAATTLFGMWTATEARRNAPYPSSPMYNPSAATVAGLWFFINIYAVNLIRAKFPQFAFPVINYTILTATTYTYGAIYTMPQVIAMIKLLLKAFMTGYGLALAVGLIVLPVNCRDVWKKIAVGYLETSKKLLIEQRKFLQSKELASATGIKGSKKEKLPLELVQQAHSDLFAKLSMELPMAKREIAFGQLTTNDLGELFRLLRATILPFQGMTVILDIYERMDEAQNEKPDGNLHPLFQKHMAQVMQTLHDPYATIVDAINEGLEHVLLTSKLKKPPKGKPKADEESGPAPGSPEFSRLLQDKINNFYSTRIGDIESCFRGQEPSPSDSEETYIGDIRTKAEQQQSQLYLERGRVLQKLQRSDSFQSQ